MKESGVRRGKNVMACKFFFQAKDGIGDWPWSGGIGDVNKRRGEDGGDSNAPAKSSRKQPAGANINGKQTPPQQLRKPPAQPARQFPTITPNMPAHNKA